MLFIPMVRKEDVPVWNLEKAKKGVVEEPFDKDKSVFKPWVKDTPGSLKQVLAHDRKRWKVAKFIKDTEDLKRVNLIINRNFEHLKNIYINLISCDSYPCIGLNEFTVFVKQTHIQDSTIK